ncbi:hypothetical protein OROMI_021828 [Orobanche minor]
MTQEACAPLLATLLLEAVFEQRSEITFRPCFPGLQI